MFVTSSFVPRIPLENLEIASREPIPEPVTVMNRQFFIHPPKLTFNTTVIHQTFSISALSTPISTPDWSRQNSGRTSTEFVCVVLDEIGLDEHQINPLKILRDVSLSFSFNHFSVQAFLSERESKFGSQAKISNAELDFPLNVKRCVKSRRNMTTHIRKKQLRR